MLSLLKAEFKRLFSSTFFYCVLAGVTLLNILIIGQDVFGLFGTYAAEEIDMYVTIDFFYCSNISIMFFVSLVFIPIFIGREFSDKVINNKIIAGVKRSNIVFAEFIVCAAAVLIFQAASDILSAAVCKLFVMGQTRSIFDTPKLDLFVIKTGYATALVVHCAFCVLLCMAVGSRIKSVIALIITSFILSSVSGTIYTTVLPIETQSEISQEVFQWNTDFDFRTEDYAEREYKSYEEVREENKLKDLEVCQRYQAVKGENLSGIKKPVFMFLNDILPMSQYYNSAEWQLAYKASTDFPKYMVYNLFSTLALLVVGMMIFERKELN